MKAGDQLDHYRIERLVSRSTSSTMYQATDLRTSRLVAIKVPHPEMEADPSFVDRFQREEEIGKSLNHPGVVKVLEGGDRSQMYMVSEWFDGQPLRNILSQHKRLPQDQAMRIAVNVCEALDYIHNHGVVHRNLKPENILVDSKDTVNLINFDAAAVTGASRLTFTNLAQIVGMSPYISPEELKGARGDARSDIYALGAILYEMLTGTVPFPGADPFDRLRQHPVPPREIDPAISPQLQEVLYRALEREHRNRYPSAREFALDLTHLDRVGIGERPELREWKARKTGQFARIAIYVVLAIIPIVIFGLLIHLMHH